MISNTNIEKEIQSARFRLQERQEELVKLKSLNKIKVIGIGLGETGTKTLGVALRKLGFKHRSGPLSLLRDYHAGNLHKIFAFLESVDSVEDFPWPFVYKDIDKRFSNCKFILTVRKDVEVWFDSLCRYADSTGKTENKKLAYGYYSPYDNPEYHKQLYLNHIRSVQEYFKGRDDFLTVCWEKGDTWESICNFLQLPIPHDEFPHANSSKNQIIDKGKGARGKTSFPMKPVKLQSNFREKVFTLLSQKQPVYFVQVGANDGYQDPISYYIKSRNWKGILIEPVSSAFNRLVQHYKNIDGLIFENCAISDISGNIDIYYGDDTRIASSNPEHLKKYPHRLGNTSLKRDKVKCERLNTLIEQYNFSHIDVIIIDTEGMDYKIISSIDFQKINPICIYYESHNLSSDEKKAARQLLEKQKYLVIELYGDTIALQAGVFEQKIANFLEELFGQYNKSFRQFNKVNKKTSNSTFSENNKSFSENNKSESIVVDKWFFTINEKGLYKRFYLIKGAILSCIENTSMQPICLYDGNKNELIEWMIQHGVDVVYHKPFLEPYLRQGYGERYNTFNGHWLRCDIPLISSDLHVLYTDIDILFLKDPSREFPKPKFIGCTPENPQNENYFNSGVMILNTENFRSVYPQFRNSLINRVETGFKTPPHDQRTFNDFFNKTWLKIPYEFNWRPYWGYNEDIFVLHYHGPKPHEIDALRKGRIALKDMKSNHAKIYEKSKGNYEKYLKIVTKYYKDL